MDNISNSREYAEYCREREWSGETRVRRLVPHVNTITKKKLPSGSWQYTVLDREGEEIGYLLFDTAKTSANKLTNTDLLEVVRDRLRALNRSPNASSRSRICYEKVCEAIYWADSPVVKPEEVKAENPVEEKPESDITEE